MRSVTSCISRSRYLTSTSRSGKITRGFATKQQGDSDPTGSHVVTSQSVRSPADTATCTHNTNAESRAYKSRLRKISTLDPAKLTRSDYFGFLLPIGTTGGVRFGDRLNPLEGDGNLSSFVSPTGFPAFKFPKTPGGFFYYHKYPAPAPALAGEIRFRVTKSDDPASFASGHDLLAGDALPWRNNLLSIVARVRGERIVDILLRDGLVSEEDIALAARLGMRRANRCMIVHSFGQPFYVSFSSTHQLMILGRESLRIYVVRSTFGLFVGPSNARGGYLYPWLGSALCCFERSECNGKRAAVLRVLKIIDPIRPNPDISHIDDALRDLMIMPVEGKLYPLRLSRFRKRRMDILVGGRQRPHPLATLYDNESAVV